MDISFSFFLEKVSLFKQHTTEPASEVDYMSLLPLDVSLPIFEKLKTDLPSLALVNKKWRDIADNKYLYIKLYPTGKLFGVKEWMENVGVVGNEPRLPRCIHKDFENKKGMPLLIPQIIKINRSWIQLEGLGKLVKTRIKTAEVNEYHLNYEYDPAICLDSFSDTKILEKSHWVWIDSISLQYSKIDYTKTIIDTILKQISLCFTDKAKWQMCIGFNNTGIIKLYYVNEI